MKIILFVLLVLAVIFSCGIVNLLLPQGPSQLSVDSTTVAMAADMLGGPRTATVRAAVTQTAQSVDATATASLLSDRKTATARVEIDRATQGALQITKQALDAQSMALQSTLQAAQITQAYYEVKQAATASAVSFFATATRSEQDRRDVQAANATQTAESDNVRKTASVIYVTQTAIQINKDSSAMHSTQTLEAVVVASAELGLEREKQNNVFKSLLPYMIVIAIVAVGIIIALRTTRVQQHGDNMLSVGSVLYDPRRNPGPVLVVKNGTASTPIQYPVLQADTTRRAQAVEALAAMPQGLGSPKGLGMFESPSLAVDPSPRITVLPAEAPWARMMNYPGDKLVLGAGENGHPILCDPEQNSQFLFAGMTGSGKSRGGLRPLIAQTLAAGWRVVILDRSAVDFQVFDGQQNCTIKLLGGRVRDVLVYLKAIYEEMLRRLAVLRNAGESTWGRLPGAGERILVVIDEFSNLTDDLENRGDQNALRSLVSRIASEGRKAGVHLAVALQNPTAESIDMKIKRNATPICYKVLDDTASRLVLNTGGAELLEPGQFIAQLANQQRGVAFNPADEDLLAYLQAHPRAVLPAPAWLDTPVAAAPAQTYTNPDDELDAQIIRMHKAGESMNAIQRTLYGRTGGSFFERVRRVIERADTTTTDTEG